jgi:replicative DNA helicase
MKATNLPPRQQTSNNRPATVPNLDAASQNKSAPRNQFNREYPSQDAVIPERAETQISVNAGQIKQHLTVLGYLENSDTVYIRAFYPSDDPRKNDDKGRKAQTKSFNQLIKTANKYQEEGRGVYIVVNGGGHTDKNVSAARAIFYEHDNLDKELQKGLWQQLGLPEPTFQVDTGGKSIHSYWVFSEPVNVLDWKGLQADLLEFSDADRTIKNPSRVMRLAGANHISSSGVFPTQLINVTENKYSYSSLREIIPAKNSESPPRPKPSPYNPSYNNNTWSSIDWSKSYLQALSIHRADDYNEWIAVGMALKAIDEGLLSDWDAWSGQSTKYKPGECSNKWKTFNVGNPSEEIAKLGSWAKKDGWRSPFKKDNVSYFEESNNVTTGNKQGRGKKEEGRSFIDSGVLDSKTIPASEKTIPASTDNINNSAAEEIDVTEILSEVDKLINLNLSASGNRGEFIKLSKKYNLKVLEIEKLYKERLQEFEMVEDREDLFENLTRLINTQNERLNPHDYLWGDGGRLASAMVDVAEAMPTAVEFLFTTFIPTAASCLGTAATIAIKQRGDFEQPCIFRTCLVAKSGDMKSPPQKVMIKPLLELEAEAREHYLEEKEAYLEELRIWEKGDKEEPLPSKPVCERHILQNGSIESRIAIHTENKRGYLLYKDEFSAHFTGRNKHRNGKGDDTENELTEFDGAALVKDVMDEEKRLFLAKSAISRTGTTQYDTIQKLMKDHEDSTGEFARWLVCLAQCPPSYLNLLGEDNPSNIGKLLKRLYKNLKIMPEKQYFLEAGQTRELYQHYHNYLVDLTDKEKHPGIQIALPKLRSYFARFCLLLHCVNQALAGYHLNPKQTIDTKTVLMASNLVEYYLGQLRVLYSFNSPQADFSGRVLALKRWLEGKEEATAREIARGLRQFRNLPRKELEADLQVLIDANYVNKEVRGRKTVYVSVATSDTLNVARDKIAEELINKGLDKNNNKNTNLSAVTSVAASNVDTSRNTTEKTTNCRQFFDSSPPPGSNSSQKIYEHDYASPFINTSDSENGDIWDESQSGQVFDGNSSQNTSSNGNNSKNVQYLEENNHSINIGDGDSEDVLNETHNIKAFEAGDSFEITGSPDDNSENVQYLEGSNYSNKIGLSDLEEDVWGETCNAKALDSGDSCENTLSTSDTDDTDESTTDIKDVLLEVYDQIEQRHEGVALTGIPSGFYDLDAMTCGFGEGDLIVLASRPTHGTTALALNIAQNVTELSKLPVAFFSLQHSRVELVQRMLSAEVEIESSYLKTGRVSDAQWEILSKGIDSLSRRKLNIFDSEKFRIKRIQEQAEKMSARGGVIIIDNLDKIHDLTSASAYTIKSTLKKLKQIAQDYNVPIILISNVNESVDRRKNNRPKLADLKRCDSIENIADLVMILYRDSVTSESDSNVAEIAIVKQRNGCTGRVKLLFDHQFVSFKNLTTNTN